MASSDQLENLIKSSRELAVYERFCNATVFPASLPLSAARSSMITAHAKAPCLDTLQVSLWCQICSTDNSTADILAIQNLTYRSVSQMCLDALRVSQPWVLQDIPCGQCKTALTALVDFHHFEISSASDIVVRWFRSPVSGKPTYQMLTMDGAGTYSEADTNMILAGENAIPQAIAIALSQSLQIDNMEETARNLKTGLRECPQLFLLVSIAGLFLNEPAMRGVVEA